MVQVGEMGLVFPEQTSGDLKSGYSLGTSLPSSAHFPALGMWTEAGAKVSREWGNVPADRSER